MSARRAKIAAKTAPERMLWASNWPHPRPRKSRIDAWMLDMLLGLDPLDEAARKRRWSTIRLELYGFDK